MTADEHVREHVSIGFAMRGTVPRVLIGGELSRRTQARVAEQLEMVLAALPDRRVEFDLRGVGHIDPAGVALLARLRREHGTDRLLIIPSEAIARTVHYVAAGERNRGRRSEDHG